MEEFNDIINDLNNEKDRKCLAEDIYRKALLSSLSISRITDAFKSSKYLGTAIVTNFRMYRFPFTADDNKILREARNESDPKLHKYFDRIEDNQYINCNIMKESYESLIQRENKELSIEGHPLSLFNSARKLLHKRNSIKFKCDHLMMDENYDVHRCPGTTCLYAYI